MLQQLAAVVVLCSLCYLAAIAVLCCGSSILTVQA
jgi:hypothetical protein